MMTKTQDFLEKIFLPPIISEEFNVDRYIRDLEEGKFDDEFNLGILEQDSGKWLLKDFEKSPNVVYIGAMGSGKSESAKFTLITWMLANSHKTQLFIVDTLKDAGDYKDLFEKDNNGKNIYPQVFEVLNSTEKVQRLLDLIWDEYEDRTKLFKTINANKLSEFEKKTGRTINRCIVLFEEFHNIFQVLDFKQNYKNDNTPANKLWKLLKVGRSAGIWFIGCSQKGTSSDIAPEVIQNFLNKQIFKVSPTESSYLVGSSEASRILDTEKGRCLSEHGFIQFPYIKNEKDIRRLLKTFVRPLKGEFAFLNPKIIEDVINGNSLIDFYRNKKLDELMRSIESFDAKTVVTVLHQRLDHEVEELELANSLGVSHIVTMSKDVKIAVMTRAATGQNKIGAKHVLNLIKAMNNYECNRGIIYTSAGSIVKGLYDLAKENHIEIVDHEDMINMAIRMERDGENMKFDPTRLADDSKESGEYQRKNNIGEEFDAEDYQTFDQKFEKDDEDKSMMEIVDDQVSKKAETKDQPQKPTQPIKELKIEDVFDLPEEPNSEAEENQETDNTEESQNETADDVVENVSDDSTADTEDFTSFENEEVLSSEENVEAETTLDTEPKEVLEADSGVSQAEDEPQTTPVVEEAPVDKKIVIKDEIQNAKKDIENFLTQKVTLSKSVKRVKVTKVFTLKSDATPFLMLHVLRNEGGDIYRMLFLVIDNLNVKHQYFLDRKVMSQFSHKEKLMLGVESIDDWNSQREVLDPDIFDAEVMAFLENFQPCQFPVHSICWKKDIDVVKRFLKPCPYMIDNPQSVEDIVFANYGLENNSRQDLINHYSLKPPKNVTIFTPIEIDLKIWEQIN